LKLTSSVTSEEELATAWLGQSNLSSEYPLHSGRIVSRQALLEAGPTAINAKVEAGRRRVAANMEIAKAVWRIFAGDDLRMFAISGGNSYGFARSGDDIDIFCVTKTGGLWLFVMKHLLVSRFYETFRKDIPRLCFSYALDEENARREFSESKDRLFARDALNLKVIAGRGFFSSLMSGARWMGELFPRAYAARAKPQSDTPERAESSAGARVLNMLLFRTVGVYIRLKSALDNAKNRKMGRTKFVNDLRIGAGYVLFESRKYQSLRGIYAGNPSKQGLKPDSHQSSCVS